MCVSEIHRNFIARRPIETTPCSPACVQSAPTTLSSIELIHTGTSQQKNPPRSDAAGPWDCPVVRPPACNHLRNSSFSTNSFGAPTTIATCPHVALAPYADQTELQGGRRQYLDQAPLPTHGHPCYRQLMMRAMASSTPGLSHGEAVYIGAAQNAITHLIRS